MPAISSYRHVFLLVAATACWGFGTVLSKQVLDRGVAPLTLLAVELTASGMLLLLATLLLGVRLTWSPAMVKLAVLGLLKPRPAANHLAAGAANEDSLLTRRPHRIPQRVPPHSKLLPHKLRYPARYQVHVTAGGKLDLRLVSGICG